MNISKVELMQIFLKDWMLITLIRIMIQTHYYNIMYGWIKTAIGSIIKTRFNALQYRNVRLVAPLFKLLIPLPMDS